MPPLQCTCNPKLSANVFDALAETIIVWYYYIGLLGVVTGSISWCLFSAWIVYFPLNSVESPCGVLAVLKCILQMLFFFMQQLCVGAPQGYIKLLVKIFSLGPDEDRTTC